MFPKKKRKKKKKKELFKKGLGTRGIRLVLPRLLSKKKKIVNQNFQFHEKIQDFQIFQKKKKNSSLNSSLGTESYDPLPYFPVVQHQVNCPPSAFIEAWSMSQTRGIRLVCQSLFNE